MSDWELDHLVLASCNLESDVESFEKSFSVKPIPGGTIASQGTRTAMAGVKGKKMFINVVASDPDNGDKLGAKMLNEHPDLQLAPYHYAIRTSNLAGVQSKAKSLGFESSDIEEVTQKNADGSTLKYKCLFLRGHKIGGLAPFFVDYTGSKHPSRAFEDSENCVKSAKVIIAASDDLLKNVKKLLDSVEGVEFEDNEIPGIYFHIGIPHLDMDGALICVKGFQSEGIDYKESEGRIFHWTAGDFDED